MSQNCTKYKHEFFVLLSILNSRSRINKYTDLCLCYFATVVLKPLKTFYGTQVAQLDFPLALHHRRCIPIHALAHFEHFLLVSPTTPIEPTLSTLNSHRAPNTVQPFTSYKKGRGGTFIQFIKNFKIHLTGEVYPYQKVKMTIQIRKTFCCVSFCD